MKVALIQIDGKLPNLALMQIAGYHKANGDSVSWYPGDLYRCEFDLVYGSTLFSDSPRDWLPSETFVGGTGVDDENTLPEPIDLFPPENSWFLYPNATMHMGMTMKGCRFACEFCCVPKKEGPPRPNTTVSNLLTNPNGGRRIMLLDNDFFGGQLWRDNIEEIIDRKLKVSFAQGLNIRIITDEQAALLARTNFSNPAFNRKQVTFAWDRFDDERWIKRGIDKCVRAGIKPQYMRFFVLVGFNTTEEQDMHRIEMLRSLGCDPFVMPYNKRDPYQNKLARWVNHTAVFKSVPWKEYNGPQTNAQIDRIARSRTLPVLPFAGSNH